MKKFVIIKRNNPVKIMGQKKKDFIFFNIS